jgi:hypothetical protein
MKKIQTCTEIIRELVGDNYLYFETPLVIERPSHSIPDNIWAVCVSLKGVIHLMDAFEAWFPLEESDQNFDLMVVKLEQKLGAIISNYLNKKGGKVA